MGVSIYQLSGRKYLSTEWPEVDLTEDGPVLAGRVHGEPEGLDGAEVGPQAALCHTELVEGAQQVEVVLGGRPAGGQARARRGQ